MLVLVAGAELRVGPRRISRFVDAYLGALGDPRQLDEVDDSDILSRLQLHTSAAYVRKFCAVDDVKKESTVRMSSVVLFRILTSHRWRQQSILRA